MSFLSPDGRCYSFDHRGNGYARGEGVAALLLKPLSRAMKDGNPIRALVRAVGTNQDGHTSGGLTQPSMKMQATLIRDTYQMAGLDMTKTRFFEAHGM
jgi:acyl transferase domain-containing protein